MRVEPKVRIMERGGKMRRGEAGEVWPEMRLTEGWGLEGGSGSEGLPGLSPGSRLRPSTVSHDRTLGAWSVKSQKICNELICNEERLTIQIQIRIHKQEEARIVTAREKSLKGEWVVYLLRSSAPSISSEHQYRVLWDCCNVCNAIMRQLELMPVINICCYTRSLHNTSRHKLSANCWETRTGLFIFY